MRVFTTRGFWFGGEGVVKILIETTYDICTNARPESFVYSAIRWFFEESSYFPGERPLLQSVRV